MNQLGLDDLLTDFVKGLLKKGNINHAGNCLVMSFILKEYLSVFLDIEATIINCNVTQGLKKINHYCLLIHDNIIIDGTASQFNNKNGIKMPVVFIGNKPSFYKIKNKI